MSDGVKLTLAQRDALERFVCERGEVRAAAALGVSRNTLARALARLGVQRVKVAAILGAVGAADAKLNTGGAEAPRPELNTRARGGASSLPEDAPEVQPRSEVRTMAKRKMTIPLDVEILRAIEERRRAVPLDQPVLHTAEVVRDLLRAGIAATSAVQTKSVA